MYQPHKCLNIHTFRKRLSFIWQCFFPASILKILKFLSWIFGRVGKQFDKKAQFNFKIYDVANWETNNYKYIYTYWPISQEVKAMRKINLFNWYNIIFFQNRYRKWERETNYRRLLVFKKALWKVKASGERFIFNIF